VATERVSSGDQETEKLRDEYLAEENRLDAELRHAVHVAQVECRRAVVLADQSRRRAIDEAVRVMNTHSLETRKRYDDGLARLVEEMHVAQSAGKE